MALIPSPTESARGEDVVGNDQTDYIVMPPSKGGIEGAVKRQKGHTVGPALYECDAIIQYLNYIY